MEKLIFATNNQNKIDEVRIVLGSIFDIITLRDAGINVDIPEPYDTLEANATEKSITIYKMTNKNCFSEDTGLEVSILNGEPGVKSARYAGEDKSFEANIDKLLDKLSNYEDRNARFRTIISLIINGEETQFEGICTGVILKKRKGSMGFGYDAVFVPDGSDLSFGEMTIEEKGQFSHRKKAMIKLIDYLKMQSKHEKL